MLLWKNGIKENMDNKLTVPGWIKDDEISIIHDLMENISIKSHAPQWAKGFEKKILDVGAFTGKLFSCLYEKFPHWKYVGVDPWEDQGVHFVKDWNADYFKPGNLLDRIVKEEDFIHYCPFAEGHKTYFEEFDTNEKFDIIVLSLISSIVDWHAVINKSYNFLKDDGFLVVRNMNITKTLKIGNHYFNHSELMKDILNSSSMKFVSSEAGKKIQLWKK